MSECSADVAMRDDAIRFGRLLEIQRRICQERDLSRLPGLVMTEVTGLLAADRSTLFLLDAETMALRSCFAEGVQGNAIVVPLRMGVMGTAILQRKAINLVDAYQHPYFNSAVDTQSGYKTQSMLALPIIHADGRVIGGLQLLNAASGRFVAADEAVAEAEASCLARLPEIDAPAAGDAMAALHGRIQFDRCTVFRVDAAAGQLVAVRADGFHGKGIALNLRLGIAGLAALTSEPLLIADAHADPRFDASFDRRTGYVTRNILCAPLHDSTGATLGVIQVINRREGDFDDQDMALLKGIAGIVAIAVENASLFEDSNRQFHSALEALAASIDARDALTAGHSKRVATIAMGIAREIGFTAVDLEVLEVSALLHDYGKIGIEDAVLKKEGKLDEREFAHMKQHAALTFEILSKFKFSRKYRSVPAIASSHHESLDGSGYPLGVVAQEIPFKAKILTVADVFEALTADRHYRKGMSVEKALAILDEGVGRKFDGRIVGALKRYLQNGGLEALELR